MTRAVALLLMLLVAYASPVIIAAQEDSGPAPLRQKHEHIKPQLEKSPFGRPLHLDSGDTNGKMNGDVYAVLDHPFKRVSEGLADGAQWCDVLTLPFNVQKCDARAEGIKLFIGRTPTAPIEDATRIDFNFTVPTRSADYLLARLSAPSGPAGTRDYLITFAATPLDEKRTLVHMHYGYTQGAMSKMALQAYLATSGADKVGFSSENGSLVGGTRGVMERNTMRYFLAIDAHLDTLGKGKRARLEKWFGSTERYAKQLREMTRDEYIAIKEGKALSKEG